ncbi:hypothetical protein ACJX0J_026438, partial [Zea mays]
MTLMNFFILNLLYEYYMVLSHLPHLIFPISCVAIDHMIYIVDGLEEMQKHRVLPINVALFTLFFFLIHFSLHTYPMPAIFYR